MSRPTATERLYKSADGRYVAESDPDAAFLVAAVGQPIPDDYDGPGPAAADVEPESIEAEVADQDEAEVADQDEAEVADQDEADESELVKKPRAAKPKP